MITWHDAHVKGIFAAFCSFTVPGLIWFHLIMLFCSLTDGECYGCRNEKSQPLDIMTMLFVK